MNTLTEMQQMLDERAGASRISMDYTEGAALPPGS